MKVYNLKSTKQLPIWKLLLIIIAAIIFAPVTLLLMGFLIWLKKYCKAADYTPTEFPDEYKQKAHLVAHRGFRALAPENTLPAYLEAGKANFWGAENDIHRTKDGVWVLHHDTYTYRMMNKNLNIEKSTYDELMKLYVDNGSFYKDHPNLRITKLEEYLKVCSEYNMHAFIEIKGSSNIKYYDEIVALVKKYNVDATYISFAKDAILGMRKCTDAPLFFIVYKVDQKKVDFAKSVENCGIDFDGNDDKNKSKEIVDMITDAGIEAALWAVDDLELAKSYVDWGVKYITTNQLY